MNSGFVHLLYHMHVNALCQHVFFLETSNQLEFKFRRGCVNTRKWVLLLLCFTHLTKAVHLLLLEHPWIFKKRWASVQCQLQVSLTLQQLMQDLLYQYPSGCLDSAHSRRELGLLCTWLETNPAFAPPGCWTCLRHSSGLKTNVKTFSSDF